jgi:hypothetical protein
MKYAETRPYADPEKAARKLLEIANTVEAIQDGRIHIEKINGPFLFKEGGSPAEYWPDSNSPSHGSGCTCTRAGRSSGPPRLVPNCSPDASLGAGRLEP